MTTQKEASLLGRRGLRTDGGAVMGGAKMRDLLFVQERRVMFLGPMHLKVQLAFIDEIVRSGSQVIDPVRRDEICLEVGCKALGSTITGQMVEMGCVQVSGKMTLPYMDGYAYAHTQTKLFEFPPEWAGKTVADIQDAPAEPVVGSKFVENRFQIAPGAFAVSPGTKPIHLYGVRQSIYIQLIGYSRAHQHALIPPKITRDMAFAMGLKHPASVTNAFDVDYEIFVRMSGTPKSAKDPCMRALVFMPYIGPDGSNVIPNECYMQSMTQEAQSDTTEEKAMSDVPVVVAEVVPSVPVTPTLRTKEELQADSAALSQMIQERKQECDQIRREWEEKFIALERHIEQLKAELLDAQAAMTNMEVTEVDPRIESFEQQNLDLSKRLTSLDALIERYDQTVALLLGS